ncbi:alpha/beta hydrolase [Croceicoccus sp. BE223]|uniref:alpha/beta fold hydrolase n=1 Tax=Croceicoccus sp. BE223 TaxID=2817716 RepID=UPI002866BEDF|nr:alpha/beta hydrolase [Croceicoccus sp. BE223]MDR7103421.1 haloacetate dehalogenase [Croceicoccus sp. BE223]
MFSAFEQSVERIEGLGIAYAVGGHGPAVLLLHGYPQNRFMWARVAPLLASRFTVVCPDLRGYGDSAKPPPGQDCEAYSFRSMARDVVLLMERLGHRRFMVAGHDRGGRVGHRLARDWPERVTALAVLDLVPTWRMYAEVTRDLARTYWQWYFLPQPAPYPERMIGADPDYYFEHCLGSNGGTALSAFDPAMLAQYRRCWNDPAMIHASCNDYRAGIGIDLRHDEEDRNRKLECPVLALWARDGIMQTLFDIEAEWRKVASDVSTATVPGGHFFLDHQPEASAAALSAFFARQVEPAGTDG